MKHLLSGVASKERTRGIRQAHVERQAVSLITMAKPHERATLGRRERGRPHEL